MGSHLALLVVLENPQQDNVYILKKNVYINGTKVIEFRMIFTFDFIIKFFWQLGFLKSHIL
jgi:hypothetical protein